MDINNNNNNYFFSDYSKRLNSALHEIDQTKLNMIHDEIAKRINSTKSIYIFW